MTTTSHLPARSRLAPALLALIGVSAVLAVLRPSPLSAQSRPDAATLRTQLERRFDVLPIREGFVLRPRTPGSVRSIEVAGGAIALDGQAVTGAELRTRLGADADIVLQLSYLDDTARRTLFDASAPGVAAPAPPPAPPAPPAASEPPPPAAAPDVPVPPSRPATRRERRTRRDQRGDVVRFGGSVNVDPGESIPGNVVVLGGSARIAGTVDGDVVVIGGSLDLDATADVGGNAVVVGGRLKRDPAARVNGDVQEVAVGPLNINWRGPGREFGNWWQGGPFGRTFSLFATLVRVGVLCLLAALVTLFGRHYTDRIVERAVAEPLKAGAIGFLAQILFFPALVVTVVLFAVTIIGIPLLLLLPFAILGLIVLALMGFTAVAAHVGRVVSARFGWPDYGPVGTAALGVVLVASPVILGRVVGLAGGPLWFLSVGLIGIGLLVEYLAWTVGMGAVALSRFSRGLTGGGAVTGPVGPTPTGPLGPPTDVPTVA